MLQVCASSGPEHGKDCCSCNCGLDLLQFVGLSALVLAVSISRCGCCAALHKHTIVCTES